MLTLAQAHALLPTAQLVGDPAIVISRVHSDTRSVMPGDLFVALQGERFDAHAFLAQAIQAGAVAVMAERGEFAHGLKVMHSQAGLTALSQAWRQRFHLPMIAVTGSNGKTTVTQMIASILRAWLGDGALATAGNYNNHIGVPLTLLRLRQDDMTWHRAAVVELGMNHPGEIAQLAALVQPTVALVNNAQREHQEFMANVKAVALENGSVLASLSPSGVAVFPGDDEHTALWRELAGTHAVLTFGAGQHSLADVVANGVWHDDHWLLHLRTPQGVITASLAVPGQHNVMNAAAAVACAQSCRRPDGRHRARSGRICTRQRALANASGAPGVDVRDVGGRYLQRQPRFGARGHRCARHDAVTTLAGAGRHG